MKLLWSKSKELLDLVPKGLRAEYWIFTVKRRPWLRNTVICLSLAPFLVAGMAYYYMFHYTGDLKDARGQKIDLEKTGRSSFKRSSYIYANNGEMTGRFFEEIRDPARLNEVPEQVRNGFIAAEDKRFYSSHYLHPGVDPIAIVRAAIGNGLRKYLNIRYFKNSGASSIAQQYVRLTYADELPEFRNRDKTLSRKIKEARIAIQVVKRYSRDKILEDFLNMIYFGHGVNGVAEASQRYFGKDIRRDKLTLREISILVSLNKSPSLYCPIIHKPAEPKFEGIDPAQAAKVKEEYDNHLAKEIVRLKNARDRYNWVLGRMLDDGYVNQKDHDEAFFKEEEPLELGFLTLKPLKDRSYGYSNRMIKELLLSQGHSDEDLSYYGGFRIHTTFDPKIQKIASEEFEKHLTAINAGKKPEDRLNGAFVVIEVKTGKVLALSGGNDFNETQYNRVLASRSPGSGFKPFTYAAAIEYFHKDFFDQICNCPFSMRGGGGKTWAPQNFREENPVPYGYINFSTGLIRSVNLSTLNLARSIGMKPIVELANSMGVWGNPGMVRDSEGDIWFKKPGYEIRGGLVPLLPTAIGASDVNLLELANAYAVFFRNGIYVRPTLVTEVKSTYGDEVIYKPEAYSEKRVLSAETSNKILALMRATTKIGTAKISMRDIEQQVACKTGTSNGPRDVSMWCGTPELVIAIRFGVDDYRVVELPDYMRKASGRTDMQVTGGWVAGPLVRKIVDRIYKERPKVKFSPAVETELQRLVSNPQ